MSVKTPQAPTKTKRRQGLTLPQAIITGTVIALLCNGFFIVQKGLSKTLALQAAHNQAALLALAHRNLTLASWLVGSGIAITLLPKTGETLGKRWVATLESTETVRTLAKTGIGHVASRVMQPVAQGWHLLTLTFAGIVIKVVSLVASWLLLVLATLLGLLDGFSRRYVRTLEGGRESTYVYHKAARSSVSLPGFCLVLYIVLPVSLSPEWVVMVLAVVLFGLVRLSASQFKKYV